MSDRATLRRLLREHAEAVSTEIAFIKEDAILRLFDATQSEHDAQVAALQAALEEANEDAERLAAGDGSVTGFHITYCRYCSKGFEWGSRTQEIRHAADCPITLHRARVGGGK